MSEEFSLSGPNKGALSPKQNQPDLVERNIEGENQKRESRYNELRSKILKGESRSPKEELFIVNYDLISLETSIRILSNKTTNNPVIKQIFEERLNILKQRLALNKRMLELYIQNDSLTEDKKVITKEIDEKQNSGSFIGFLLKRLIFSPTLIVKNLKSADISKQNTIVLTEIVSLLKQETVLLNSEACLFDMETILLQEEEMKALEKKSKKLNKMS